MASAHFRVEELVEHAAFVRGLARALTRDEHAADDVSQETWRAALVRPPLRGREVLPWLAGVVRRIASRRRRDDARRGDRELRAARAEALPAAATIVEREETLRAIVDAVLALPEPYRSTVLLRFYENRPPRAIAARMGVAVDTVHTRIRRALAILRERLAAERLDCGALLALAMPRVGDGWIGGVGTSLGIAMKTKLIVAACAVALVGAGAWLWLDLGATQAESRAASVSPLALAPTGGATGVAADESGASARTGASRSGVATPTEVPPAVSGRVFDTEDRPVAKAVVFVGAEADPFGPDCTARRLELGAWHGRCFETDSNGRYRAVPHDTSRVLVTLHSRIGYAPAGAGFVQCEPVDSATRERWVDAPAESVDFVVCVIPTARVSVRAEYATSRKPLDRFHVALKSDNHGSVQTLVWSKNGAVNGELPVRNPGGERWSVELVWPVTPPPVETQVLLTPNAEIEVVLVVPSEGSISGYVVDDAGHGIEGAHVFFGDSTVARGDEPFKPFDAKRLPSSAKSGPDGWFEIEGDGPLVTAWHADFSEATVERASASRIVLRARATVSGRLVDESGAAVTERELVLGARKGGLTSTTDALGRFRFERVEAGAHGVWLGGALVAGVRVDAGEDLEIELAMPANGRFELAFVDGGSPIRMDGVSGLLVGLDRTFGVYGVLGGSIEEPVLAGRYVYVDLAGRVTELDVAGERATVEVGRARLVVRAALGTKVHAVPAHADRFTRLMAARLPGLSADTGELVFQVAPGSYALVGHAGGLIRDVEVDEEGATIDLR